MIKAIVPGSEIAEYDLAAWMKSMLDRKQFYDCSRNDGVLAQYRLVSSYVADAYSSKQNAIRDFLKPGVADPWLAAYAMAHGGTIVTQETAKLSKRKASLVDICDYFGVRHMDMIEFLRIEKARFVLDGNARLKGQRITSCCACSRRAGKVVKVALLHE